jgi:hypothetical protein
MGRTSELSDNVALIPREERALSTAASYHVQDFSLAVGLRMKGTGARTGATRSAPSSCRDLDERWWWR